MANIELDGVNKTIKVDSGDLTLDIPGDIIFDSDAPNWRFKDAGTSILEIGAISNGTSFYNAVSDADMHFKGNDGGSAITALTLDMSEAGYGTFNNWIKVNDRVVGNSNLVLTSTDGNEKIHLDASGYMKLETNGSERMRIISDGKVGINESTPTTQLQITGASGAGGTISLKRPDTTVTAGQTLGGIEFITADSGSAGIAARILGEADGTGGEGKIVFATGTGGSTSTAWTITSGGDLLPGATDHGIHLGVTSATASNLLDDYETGDCTFGFTTASGAATMNGTYKVGQYVKVGDQVTVTGYAVCSAIGSATGGQGVTLTGLPFSIIGNNGAYSGLSCSYGEGLNITAGQVIGGYARINYATVPLLLWDSTTGSTSLEFNELSADGGIIFSITYFVA